MEQLVGTVLTASPPPENPSQGSSSRLMLASTAVLVTAGAPGPGLADKTSMCRYTAKILGQEDSVYVWTQGYSST